MVLTPRGKHFFLWLIPLYTCSAQRGRLVQPHGAHSYAEGSYAEGRHLPLVIRPTILVVLSETAQYFPWSSRLWHVPLVTGHSITTVLREAAQYNPMELNPMTRSSYDWSLYTYSAQQGRSVQPHGAHPYAEGKHVPLVIGPSIPAVLSEAAQYNPMELTPMLKVNTFLLWLVPLYLQCSARPLNTIPWRSSLWEDAFLLWLVPLYLQCSARLLNTNPVELTPMLKEDTFLLWLIPLYLQCSARPLSTTPWISPLLEDAFLLWFVLLHRHVLVINRRVRSVAYLPPALF